MISSKNKYFLLASFATTAVVAVLSIYFRGIIDAAIYYEYEQYRITILIFTTLILIRKDLDHVNTHLDRHHIPQALMRSLISLPVVAALLPAISVEFFSGLKAIFICWTIATASSLYIFINTRNSDMNFFYARNFRKLEEAILLPFLYLIGILIYDIYAVVTIIILGLIFYKVNLVNILLQFKTSINQFLNMRVIAYILVPIVELYFVSGYSYFNLNDAISLDLSLKISGFIFIAIQGTLLPILLKSGERIRLKDFIFLLTASLTFLWIFSKLNDVFNILVINKFNYDLPTLILILIFIYVQVQSINYYIAHQFSGLYLLIPVTVKAIFLFFCHTYFIRYDVFDILEYFIFYYTVTAFLLSFRFKKVIER